MAMVCCSFWGLQIIAYSFLDQGEWDRALVVWTCRGSLREDSQKRKRNKSRHGRTRARRETWSKIDHSKDREFEVQPADNWKMGQEMAQLWMVWLSKQPILERQLMPHVISMWNSGEVPLGSSRAKSCRSLPVGPDQSAMIQWMEEILHQLEDGLSMFIPLSTNY